MGSGRSLVILRIRNILKLTLGLLKFILKDTKNYRTTFRVLTKNLAPGLKPLE